MQKNFPFHPGCRSRVCGTPCVYFENKSRDEKQRGGGRGRGEENECLGGGLIVYKNRSPTFALNKFAGSC